MAPRKGFDADRSALSPLEFRLERNKCLSNLGLEFFDSLYDRRPICERYLDGHVHLHLHGRLSGYGMGRFTFVAKAASDVLFQTGMDRIGPATAGIHEMPVSIWIGAVSEPSRPIASLVWLQALNCCNMSSVGACKVASLGLHAPLETLWRVFNWKLRAFLLGAGIELGEREDEIIEGGTQVVENLAHENGWAQIEEGFGRQGEVLHAMRGIRIELDADGICLFKDRGVDLVFEISKVFLCPPYSLERAVERMKLIAVSHGAPKIWIVRCMEDEYAPEKSR